MPRCILKALLPPTSRMRRFTEVLLLAACILLPPWLVNGLEAFQPAIKYKAEQKNTVIRGLLVTRQSYYYCPDAGDYICESTHCCPGGWNCCEGSSLTPNYKLFLSKFGQLKKKSRRWQLLCTIASSSLFGFKILMV